jgi:hypothetical protein
MLQYLQNYSGKRTNTYYNIYTPIQGRELTHTAIFIEKSNFREKTNTYHIIYKTIQGRELTLPTIFTKLFRGEN